MAIDPVCRALIALLVLALVTGRRSAAAAGALPALEEQQGVVCTMVKNETRYIAEWLAFHLDVQGATKVVVYDDNQGRDSLREVAAPFGDRVVIHDLSRMPELPSSLRAPGWTVYIARQRWSFNHCGRTYGGRNQTGWLAVIDVDEFIFPCHESSTSLGEAFTQRIGTMTPGTVGLRLECLKFGFNDLGRPLRTGELLVETESRRAPYPELEPQVETAQRKALSQCIRTERVCANTGDSKVIYTLNDAGWARPAIHGPQGSGAGSAVNVTWDRSSGVCCNHYMLRSKAEVEEKYNKQRLIAKFMPTFMARAQPQASAWYHSVPDVLAWRFLPRLKEALYKHGWKEAGHNTS